MDTIKLMESVDYIFTPIKSVKNGKDYFVYKTDGAWSIHRDNQIDKNIFKSTSDILMLNKMNNIGLDFESFDKALLSTLSIDYVFFQSKAYEFRDIIGDGVADNAWESHEQFKKMLSSSIKKSLNPFKVVGND